ncbi:BOS complex subunit ncln [Culicoides brevitarsis]|uniref:BOS complex subunit ncln n=1 Tax=Culicoides brevitarsis TaxID=469753 RepID=UPI00307C9C8D
MFEEGAEGFSSLFPYYLLVLFPTLLILSPSVVTANPQSTFPLTVSRMSQFDLYGNFYGCRASALNLEAKSLYTWSTSRHCVVTKLEDLTIDHYKEIRSKAGGLVILMPKDFSLLSYEEKQQIRVLEQVMLQLDISIPVYFAPYKPQLEEVIGEISRASDSRDTNKKRESALTEIFNTISANGYQIMVQGATHAVNKASKIPILQGEMVKPVSKNTEADSKLPMIMVVAHLENFGLINQQLSNNDVAILLSLVDLFSKLNNGINTSPKYRLLFLVTESGPVLNYQGTKKWLDVNIDENALSQKPEFVVCLDSLGRSTEKMFMHVSKPPKEGTQMNNFFKILKTSAEKYGNMSLEGIHKKINLADVTLAWEHERFSMKRMPGLTISNMKNHKEPLRTTIFEDEDSTSMEAIEMNTKIIAEALARYVYDINDGEIFTGTMAVTRNLIKPWLNIKSTQLNNDLKNAFEKYLKNVKLTYEKPDPREPDFMLYTGHDAQLNVYNVKPAIFDLFLTFVIAIYLCGVYFGILYFPKFYDLVCKMNICSGTSANGANNSINSNSNGKAKAH